MPKDENDKVNPFIKKSVISCQLRDMEEIKDSSYRVYERVSNSAHSEQVHCLQRTQRVAHRTCFWKSLLYIQTFFFHLINVNLLS
jgi:hypothetical protein